MDHFLFYHMLPLNYKIFNPVTSLEGNPLSAEFTYNTLWAQEPCKQETRGANFKNLAVCCFLLLFTKKGGLKNCSLTFWQKTFLNFPNSEEFHKKCNALITQREKVMLNLKDSARNEKLILGLYLVCKNKRIL